MPGRTDAVIVADAVATHEVSTDALTRFQDLYVTYLAGELEHPGPRKGVMPGVRPLLDALTSRVRRLSGAPDRQLRARSSRETRVISICGGIFDAGRLAVTRRNGTGC